MKNTKRVAGAVSSVLALTSFLSPGYASEPPIFLEFTRPLGMGGAFTAVADDHSIFSYNPAGMVQRTGSEVTLLDASAGVSEDFTKTYNYVKDHQDDFNHFNDPNFPATKKEAIFNDIQNTFSKLNPRADAGLDVASYVSGPNFMGMPVHVGFGAFGIVNAGFNLNSNSGLIPEISYNITNDILLPLTVAKRWDAPFGIPGRIGAGITGKLVLRNEIEQQNVSVLNLDNINAPPLQRGKGYGSDLGFLYQPTNRTNVGVMVQDFLGTKMKFDALSATNGFQAQPERDTVIHPRTNIGVAFHPQKLLWLVDTGDRLVLAADVRDVTASDQHVFFQNGMNRPFGVDLPTHLYMGAEFRYWFLRFRGGAYQGYPSLGLGIDIPLIKIDVAYYSREDGLRAGDIQEKNYVASVALRFGTGKTEDRERIVNRKQHKREDSAVPEATPNSSDNTSPATSTTATPPAPSTTATPAASSATKGKASDTKKAAPEAPKQDESLPQ